MSGSSHFVSSTSIDRSAARYASRSIHPRGRSPPICTSVRVDQPRRVSRLETNPLSTAWTPSRCRCRSWTARSSTPIQPRRPSAASARSTTARSTRPGRAVSRRQIADCDVPARWASSRCDQPTTIRASRSSRPSAGPRRSRVRSMRVVAMAPVVAPLTCLRLMPIWSGRLVLLRCHCPGRVASCPGRADSGPTRHGVRTEVEHRGSSPRPLDHRPRSAPERAF